ncbi:LLM class flavin-dependent oxidoreductase [soil metagenome]
MILNILDQSPVVEGSTYSDALKNTIELAKLADRLNYKRYWVAEHHSSNSFAGTSPEILIGKICSETKNIKAGSGGVLISHYAPFKIAEQFRTLEALYPDRIDLGIGRAPGGDALIVKALKSDMGGFEKTDELITYLEDKNIHKANPQTESIPELWILGTSPDSALYAAKKGLRYCFGSFINDEQRQQALQSYYINFQPSKYLKEPYVNIAVVALAADSQEEADKFARASEYWLAQSFLLGKNIRFPSTKTFENYKFSVEEQFLINYRRNSVFIGKSNEVKDRLSEFVKKIAAHELTIVTITEHQKDRVRSYELLAKEFGITC